MHAFFLLHFVQKKFEWIFIFLGLWLHTQHHITIHLHKSTVTIPSKTLVTGFLDQPLKGLFIKTNIQNGIHHTGHGNPGTATAGNEKGVFWIAKYGTHFSFGFLKSFYNLSPKSFWVLTIVIVKISTDFCGNGKTCRHRKSNIAHFCKIGTLPTKQVFHV